MQRFRGLFAGWACAALVSAFAQAQEAQPPVEAPADVAQATQQADDALPAEADPGGQTAEPAESEEPAGTAVSPPPAPEVDPKPIEGAQELLELYGVSLGYWSQLRDRAPLTQEERNVALRMLAAVARFRPGEIFRWTEPSSTTWQSLAAATSEHQGKILLLEGQVRRVDEFSLHPDDAELFGYKNFCLCELDLPAVERGGTPQRALVYSLHAPRSWKRSAPLSVRSSVRGFFLKVELDENGATPVFLAQRLGNYPPTLLGDLGMDYGLFDDIQNKQPLRPQERECFYELLAASGRALTSELARRKSEVETVVPLFLQPDEQLGKFVLLDGTAKRAIRVAVEDPEIAERFGISEYYQVDFFTPDSQGNPLIACMLKLPPGMPEGEDIYEPVRIPAFYFKLWTYAINLPDEDAEDPAATRRVGQPAPMLVGRELLWLREGPTPNTISELIAGGLFAAAVCLAWFVVWRMNRSDRKFKQRVLSRVGPTEKLELPTAETEATAPAGPGEAEAD